MIRLIAIILTLVAANRAATFSRRAVGGCETQADVTFVLDSSDIVGKDNFDKELDFIANTVSQMDTSPGKTRVSIVTYSSGVYNQFFLKSNPTRNEILHIPFRGGRTHTADAIRYVTQTSFNPIHGARNNVPHIAVMVTNSPSSSKQITKIEAQSAKDNNIIMYSVAVGSSIDKDELQTVASDPDSRYFIQAQNYGALGSIAGPLATKLCNELPSTSAALPAPTSCLHKADLAFLIDSSTSVGPANFQKMENFLKQSISKLDVGPDKVHVGLMQYSSYPNVEFPLNMYTDRIDALKAVENIHYMSGGTNTADAIKYMREHMFSLNSGARGNVPRIAIVVTDGGSINGASTTYQADQARQTNNIGLIAVGVGNNINKNELDSIADNPASQHVITVSSYDQLDQIVDQLLAKTCTITPTVQSMVTAAPGGTLPSDTCVDKVKCASYGQQVCTNYGPWANDNCARFCGVCTPLFTTPAACQDTLATCSTYGPSSCTQFPEWAKANCNRFCGLCDATASSTGFYGKCSYKGQVYQTGAKWSDACDYDCICEDGNTGRYKCFNKCPLYHGLPKDCTLIKKDGECCLQPVCNFHQTIQKFESTGKGQTASGIKICVSNGKQYFQDQTWEDGCSKQCVCTNATEGLYTCDAICPSYNNIPSNCHLDQKPGDCCQKPICEYDQQHGSFTGMGTVSGQGIGAHPSTPIPCVDRVNTCAQYGKDVCTNYQGWSSDNCRKFCGICGGEPTPNSHDKCVYQGQSHGQGQSWTIGCDTQCTCENAAYGYYRCDNTCPKYNNLPAGCYETKHSTDCCTTVRCDSGNFIGSTTDPNSIGSGGLIHVLNPTGSQHVVSPTQPSGATVAPGTGGTGFIAPTLKGCLFKGQLYVQDQTWEDGCSYSCRCTDSTKGVYSCRPKCPMYKNLPSSCPMQTDPNDPCCQAPKCRYDPITGSTFIPIPAFQPAVQYHGLVRPPTVGELYNQMEYTGSVLIFGTNLTPAPPTQRANTTGGIGHCDYRGKLYTQGQTWEDGCDYNCVCEDSRSGLYRCIERCNHFGNLPQPYCYLKQDPANPCCKIPYCDFPVNYVTNTGYISTAKPPSDHCEYKGTQYKQDQSWYDGCNFQCTCDDALSGNYRCLSRCPAYKNINSSCTMVPDPSDPYCCTIPSCPSTNVAGNTSTNPTPAPSGYYSGYQGASIGKCIYKGDSYVQGATWSDGCDYNCECVEAGKGHYTCTDKCLKYPSLPSQCRLISDFTNPCCKRPVCDGQSGSVVTGLNPVIGGTTAAPNPIPTLAPNAQYCVYENAQYVQGQTWEVGCEYRCRCDDASRGVYVCNERCPKYNNLGSECSLVADNKDGCCLAPRCIFPPLTGNATGSFTPDMIPTAAPGVISGSINIPTPAPVPGGSTVAPPVLTWCEYKGARYGQDEKWYDGCGYECECVVASTGKFKCVERCRRYLNLPAQCRLVKDPSNPCCKAPECDFTGVTQGITNFPTPPGGVPTLGPPGPGGNPTLAPNPTSSPTPAPTDACVYKGKNYNQGMQWYDGCDYVCYCENGPAGVYRCSERCAAFPKLPASCQLVPDPKDPFCCKVPECSFTPANGTYTGYGYPTAPTGVITGGSVVKPTPRPNVVPTAQPIPGVSTVAPTPVPSQGPTFKDVCVYKGQQYTQGQKWEDGCDYNCECTDAKTGFYQCSERCPRFVNLPDGCTLQRDYVNPCCMKPYCVLKPTPKPAVTPSLGPGQTPSLQPTASPNPVCMYNGVPFTQGQSWSDGCELKCVCENATTGYFRCNDRCPHYDLTPGCTMITDPRDSCCVRPYCDPRITPTPGPAIPTAPGVPGQMYTPQPGQTFAPGLYPTLPGGIPLMPGLMLTPAPGQTYAPGLYPTLPGGATLVPPMAQTPYPGYTYPAPIPTAPGIPGQIYTPAPGKTYAPNLYPTIPGGIPLVPGMMLTPAPGQTYAPGLYPTLPGGVTLVPPMINTPYPVFTPAPIPTAPGVPGQMYTPAPGQTYAPNLYPTIPGGKPLVPGMILTPLPGQTYAPGLYPTLPGGATLVPPFANTPRPAYTNAPIPTAPGIPGQTYTPSPGKTYAPYLYPTVPGGETLMPGMMLTPAPGQVYIPGYYPTLPGGATLVPPLAYTPPSLNTPAPKIPTAPGIIGQTYTPSPGHTFAPGLYPTVPGGQTLVPGMMLTPQPGQTYAPGLSHGSWCPRSVIHPITRT
ncbi:Cartilage matrix protein [Mizuhopecten yessoensis]|uniref:Cartilage matrix protein n=1 Tax=Mizuhopecten yessoensis TaxID=6573 RepID=A0A210QXV2_MIZYE|nr:Cartilage matrix protein [Mizuhopecten yessoensis]